MELLLGVLLMLTLVLSIAVGILLCMQLKANQAIIQLSIASKGLMDELIKLKVANSKSANCGFQSNSKD